jgi:hypothetical protein
LRCYSSGLPATAAFRYGSYPADAPRTVARGNCAAAVRGMADAGCPVSRGCCLPVDGTDLISPTWPAPRALSYPCTVLQRRARPAPPPALSTGQGGRELEAVSARSVRRRGSRRKVTCVTPIHICQGLAGKRGAPAGGYTSQLVCHVCPGTPPRMC